MYYTITKPEQVSIDIGTDEYNSSSYSDEKGTYMEKSSKFLIIVNIDNNYYDESMSVKVNGREVALRASTNDENRYVSNTITAPDSNFTIVYEGNPTIYTSDLGFRVIGNENTLLSSYNITYDANLFDGSLSGKTTKTLSDFYTYICTENANFGNIYGVEIGTEISFTISSNTKTIPNSFADITYDHENYDENDETPEEKRLNGIANVGLELLDLTNGSVNYTIIAGKKDTIVNIDATNLEYTTTNKYSVDMECDTNNIIIADSGFTSSDIISQGVYSYSFRVTEDYISYLNDATLKIKVNDCYLTKSSDEQSMSVGEYFVSDDIVTLKLAKPYKYLLEEYNVDSKSFVRYDDSTCNNFDIKLMFIENDKEISLLDKLISSGKVLGMELFILNNEGSSYPSQVNFLNSCSYFVTSVADDAPSDLVVGTKLNTYTEISSGGSYNIYSDNSSTTYYELRNSNDVYSLYDESGKYIADVSVNKNNGIVHTDIEYGSYGSNSYLYILSDSDYRMDFYVPENSYIDTLVINGVNYDISTITDQPQDADISVTYSYSYNDTEKTYQITAKAGVKLSLDKLTFGTTNE